MHSDSDGSTPMFEGERLIGGRYRLLEKIGEGGAAEVFRARDQRLDRIVAIKLLRPQYMHDPASHTRFVNEAKAAAGLAHPNIVDIYDFGEGPDGSTFIAMQYVEGQDLKEILQRRGRLTPAETISIARQVCYALAAAHAQGLVHRDVKPQNILIDRGGNARLTDFGIVKALSGPALTQSGMTFGTAAYLSPEQATGEPVGPASDVYALGCVMYEMLSGTPPFTGENPAVVAYKQVWEQPRPLHDVVPEVLPSLESVVMRCLNKDPRARYPTTQALAADLDAISNSFNQPTQAVSLGTLASAAANAGEWTPANSRVPAERSAPIQMPAVVPSSNGGAVPPVRAQTTGYSSAPVPHVAPAPPAQATPYTAQPARNMEVLNVKGWLPALLVLLGLGLMGLLAWQGGLFNALGIGNATPTPEPVATATSLPPSPTVHLGGIIVGSPLPPTPQPLPSSTPLPPTETPTGTPVPAPPTEEPPTDTPAAPALPTRPSRKPQPTDTVEQPAPTVPPPVPPGANSITLEDSSFAGGYRRQDGLYHRRTATWVYGQGTQYKTMSATFNLDHAPAGIANLSIVGLDSEDAPKTPIRIDLNGTLLYQGPNPLPNDLPSGVNGKGNWGSYTFQMGEGILQPGSNTLTITNLDPSDKINAPPFFMLDYATISWG